MSICDNYKSILNKVSKVALDNNKCIDDILILAVSKTHSVDKIVEAIDCGIKVFGESRVQEAIEKINYIKSLYKDIEFHYIGKIQRNKVSKIVEKFSLIYSVDRKEVLNIVNDKAKEISKLQDILIQINISREQQKSGVLVENLESLLDETIRMDYINLKGFMMMPPNEEDPELNRKYFKEMYNLFIKYKNYKNFNLSILSMGMSGDFEIAISEGANNVRIGSTIFGDRL